jgi:hypothetical protein
MYAHTKSLCTLYRCNGLIFLFLSVSRISRLRFRPVWTRSCVMSVILLLVHSGLSRTNMYASSLISEMVNEWGHLNLALFCHEKQLMLSWI